MSSETGQTEDSSNEQYAKSHVDGVVIRRGPTNGKYFTQWRIDLLDELLGYVVNGFGLSEGVNVSDATTWYDSQADYHMLSYTVVDKEFRVRLYKVFSSNVNGDDKWVGCPRRNILSFAKHLRDAVAI